MDINARLKNMFKLSSRVTIYVPSTINVNETFDNSKYIDETATLLSDCFGGATSTNALGYWVSNTHGLVKEASTLVFAYCTTEQLNEHFDKVIDWCKTMCIEMSQEAIALELNGEMYFID